MLSFNGRGSGALNYLCCFMSMVWVHMYLLNVDGQSSKCSCMLAKREVVEFKIRVVVLDLLALCTSVHSVNSFMPEM